MGDVTGRALIIAGLLAIGVSVAGCTGAQVRTTVAEAEVALTGADQLALKYVTLPVCPQTNGALCSDPAISAKIKTAAATAYTAVKAAEASGGSADLAAANAAIAALTAVVPTAN